MEVMEALKGKVNNFFWQSKKVFLTGHTGFKGSWLSLWLQEMGAIVKGYALEAPTKPSLFEVANVAEGMDSRIADVRDAKTLFESMSDFQPEIVNNTDAFEFQATDVATKC